MRYDLMNRWYVGFLRDDEIETGNDYWYCPLNTDAKRVRITGYKAARDGTPILFYWREVKADGSVTIEENATLGLFKPLLARTKLELQIQNPVIALRGVNTAPLRRPKVELIECQC